ncbi:hypothetical protein [Sulfurimonas sp.]|uniref:hypothetical protein n=1 Tax=Sulfurimonas sp. TaxID=2022749 RepID=UPI0025FB9ED7|nr:hypothetical protein [Sulfurimonas sp.]MDD5157526.1 hypothetical protein [Sulfurimonas sp.]
MEAFFNEYKTIIVFLHVISGVVWIGGMVAMRYAAHPSFIKIESPAKRLELIADALGRLFKIVIPFVITLIITAIIMIKGYSLSQSDLSVFSHAKEGIWSMMFINIMVMIYRKNLAQKLLHKGDFVGAKNQLALIGSVMVPVNIGLGVVAIFLGTYLSGSL